MASKPAGWLRNLLVDTDEVLTEQNSSSPKLAGRTLTQCWLAYNCKALVIELCVDCSQTVGYINYKGYHDTVVSKFVMTNGRLGTNRVL